MDSVEASGEPTKLGVEATCRTCQRHIVYEVVEEPGRLPRTGWSDQFPRDALVCFSAINYQHVPNELGLAR